MFQKKIPIKNLFFYIKPINSIIHLQISNKKFMKKNLINFRTKKRSTIKNGMNT
jgi:hypothetical protein